VDRARAALASTPPESEQRCTCEWVLHGWDSYKERDPDCPVHGGESEQPIDARDCPECDNGTKGNYESRVLVDGRGFYVCPVCGTKWQDANETPSSKGVTLIAGGESEQEEPRGDG
jgi:hypothetical protein